MAGKRDKAQAIPEQLERLSKQQYVTSYPVARIYMSLGNKEEAFRWLETGHGERAAMMVDLKVDPRFTERHSDPRFHELLRRMNLAE